MENLRESNTLLISIIIPSYNRANIIQRAIDSIKAQSFPYWECIIIDDNSVDNTLEVVPKLIGEDKRFTLISNYRKKGAPGARNTGILAAHGEYIVLFDSDNVMHPDFLEKVCRTIKSEAVDVCGCFSRVIDEETKQRIGQFCWEGYGCIHNALLRGKSYFDNSSTLIKKQKLLDICLLDEDCPSFQEWDTHIRLSEDCVYTTIKEELIDYYRGGRDTISKSQEKYVLGQLYILNKFQKDFIKNVPSAYFKHNINLYYRIREISNKEQRYLLQCKFEKGKSVFFVFLIKNIYRIKKWGKKLYDKFKK